MSTHWRNTVTCLALSAALWAVRPTFLSSQTLYMPGDVNCDGCTNCLDVELLSTYLHAPPGAVALCCELAGDVNGDGVLTPADIQGLAGLPDAPGMCAPINVAGLPCGGYRDELCTSLPASCVPPVAVITGPQTIVNLSTALAPLTAWFDGRASRGSGGAHPDGFHWAVQPPGLAGFVPADPAAAVAAIEFSTTGTHVIKLDVSPTVSDPLLTQSDDAICGYTEHLVEIVVPAPGQPIRFVPLLGFQRAAVAGRHFQLPVLLSSAPPSIEFALMLSSRPPAGLTIDSKSGLIEWDPTLADVGTRTVGVAVTEAGRAPVVTAIEIVVVDPARTSVSYAPPDPAGGGGGGAINTTAPLTLEDLGTVPPQIDLALSINGPGCSVSAVPDVRAVRFTPVCDPATNGTRGKVYSSPSSVPKLNEDINNDFTIELWLANVPDAQLVPAGEVAYVFSVSGPGTQLNWLVGTKGGGEYVVQVQTETGLKTFGVVGQNFTGLRQDQKPHQLVFVRQGAENRIYVNGAPASQGNDASALQWASGLRAHVGNSQDRTRPFSGDLYLAAFYFEALDPSLIAFLSELGPFADEGDVPAPIAEVCPDPREIGRIDGDGTLSRAGWLGGGGGGGNHSDCSSLRPFTWMVRALPSNAILGFSPINGEELCSRRITVSFDESQVSGLELELTVNQVPVRDFEKSHTVTQRVHAFKRGNANNAGVVDLSDAVWGLSYLFLGAARPPCLDAADSNDDGRFDLSDPVHILNYLFQGAAAPPAPGPLDCGFDRTADNPTQLGCNVPGDGC